MANDVEDLTMEELRRQFIALRTRNQAEVRAREAAVQAQADAEAEAERLRTQGPQTWPTLQRSLGFLPQVGGLSRLTL